MNHQKLERIPLLVIDSIFSDEEEATKLVGKIRIGGHNATIVLDFRYRNLDFIGHVQVPVLLSIHPPTQRVIVEQMTKVYDGEIIDFPIDLSEEIKSLSPPSPFMPLPTEDKAALETDADKVTLNLIEFVRCNEELHKFRSRLVVDNQDITLRLEIYSGHDAIPIVLWHEGPHPEDLSPAQRYAIRRALLRAYEGLN